jgi:hypothetical protein
MPIHQLQDSADRWRSSRPTIRGAISSLDAVAVDGGAARRGYYPWRDPLGGEDNQIVYDEESQLPAGYPPPQRGDMDGHDPAVDRPVEAFSQLLRSVSSAAPRSYPRASIVIGVLMLLLTIITTAFLIRNKK